MTMLSSVHRRIMPQLQICFTPGSSLELDRFHLVGHDWGARSAYVVAALQPKRLRSIVTLAARYDSSDPMQHVAYSQAKAYWYQWHFVAKHGHLTLEKDRRGLCRYLWQTWSPSLKFDDGTFERTAKSWDNPDFVDVTLHSYRYRWGEAPVDPAYDEQEAQMAKTPKIKVPTTHIVGADDRATLPESSAGKEKYFTGGDERRLLNGVGGFRSARATRSRR